MLSNTDEPTSDAQDEQPGGTLAALTMTDAADLEIPPVLAVTLTVPLLARLLVNGPSRVPDWYDSDALPSKAQLRDDLLSPG
ncbi:hypothetical protein [Deinococcus knuensis]|uniref:Uncharacterized protein n=1 Tax=Deinococcus knuensis TaxID=1837380 RepID=A0ABQ2T1M8_9DEIO|nr:hypothetical protein [Deinococcus knuensis]GGS43513.1 hypothetical protein GCM10008961_38160 [Deinococcus knuensis]